MRAPIVAWRVGALAALVALSAVAKADTPPSVWDVAKDPTAAERWEVHVKVQRILYVEVQRETSKRDKELLCETALAMLRRANAETGSDVTLRFDLGIFDHELAEVDARADLFEAAAKVLTAAVAMAPNHPRVTEALDRIAYAYAKLNRPKDELAAWHRYIPRLEDPRTRTVSQMNMGEAEMRLGQIDDALATFREVLRECAELPNTSSTYVLTLWDLAVALDRSGGAREALDTAAKAAHETAIDSFGMPTTGRGLITRDPAVFFVPTWEGKWYLALGSSALARESTDPHDTWAYWAEAEHEWDEYIDASEASGEVDRWLPIARLRRDRAHAERMSAEKRVPKSLLRRLPKGEE